MTTTEQPGYATVATTYHQAGWHPIPIPRGKKSSPPDGTTGRDGKDPTEDDIAAWAITDPNANVALRMPAGVIGIDVDDYDNKHGATTLANLTAQHGELPPTWTSTSRGPDQPSRIYFYQCPADLELPGALGPDIEAIQRHHRYAVAAPSTRKDTGGRYRWYTPDGDQSSRPPRVDELPELPATWCTGLTARPTTPPPAVRPITDDSIMDRVNNEHDWHTLLTSDGWQQAHGDHWTRPGKNPADGTSATLHQPNGPFVVWTTSIPELQQSWALNTDGTSWTYSIFGYLAATRYGGNMSQLAREARLADNLNKLRNAPLRLNRDTSDPDTVSHEYTDVGNGRKLVHDHGHDLHYAPQWNSWLIWENNRWREDITGEVVRRAKAVVDSMETELATTADETAAKALYKHWQRSQGASKIDAMVYMATTEPGIPIRIDELDADPWLLNTTSGAINLKDHTTSQLDRRHLVTKLAPTTIDPDAQCPTWEWFLNWAMCDNTELVEFLRRAVGYTLTGTVTEQCLFFLHGGGANGKSTFLSVLQHLLGDYAFAAEADLLLASNHERHSTGVADLHGRRIVVVQETDEGRRLDEALVKRLTGGDLITARRMRQDNFQFVPTHKLWMAANHRPTVRGTDHAIWRRIRLIPFNASVTDAEQDHTLLDRLLAELPGITQWALAGCAAWQTAGLQPPAAVLQATLEYRSEQDHIGRFLDECCTLADGLTITARDLRNAYETWCNEGGERPWTAKAMAPHLLDRGCTLQRTNETRLWRHIALTGSAADELARRLDRGDWAKRASGDATETRDASPSHNSRDPF